MCGADRARNDHCTIAMVYYNKLKKYKAQKDWTFELHVPRRTCFLRGLMYRQFKAFLYKLLGGTIHGKKEPKNLDCVL